MGVSLSTSIRLLETKLANRPGLIDNLDLRRILGELDRDTPIPVLTVLHVCGVSDALTAMAAAPADQASERDRVARLLACASAMELAERMEPGSLDTIELKSAIKTAERHANGQAIDEELEDAHETVFAIHMSAPTQISGSTLAISFATTPKPTKNMSAAFYALSRTIHFAAISCNQQREWQAQKLEELLAEQ